MEARGGQHCQGHDCRTLHWLWVEVAQLSSGSPVRGRNLPFPSWFIDRQAESFLRCHESLGLYWSVILFPSKAKVAWSSVPKRDKNLITTPEFDLLSVLATVTVIVMRIQVSVTSGGWLPLGPSLSLSNIKSPSIGCIINCNKLKGIILCGQNSPRSFLPTLIEQDLLQYFSVSCLATFYSAF